MTDASLVECEGTTADGYRYLMLETVREFARARLNESGEAAEVARRHAEYFLALAELAAAELEGSNERIWLTRLDLERDNFRSALEFAQVTMDRAVLLKLAGALSWFWIQRGYYRDGADWLDTALAASDDERTPARAEALWGRGYLARLQGDFTQAAALHDDSLAIRRELGDKAGIAKALNGRALVAQADGEYEQAQALYCESLSLNRELDSKIGIATTLRLLGYVLHAWGKHDEARPFLEESLSRSRQIPADWITALALENLGMVALLQGDSETAAARLRESLQLNVERGQRRNIAGCFYKLARVASTRRDFMRAARLFGAAEALRSIVGIALAPNERSDNERDTGVVRSALGDEAFQAGWAEGSAMPLESAIAYAMGEDASALAL